MLGSRVCVWVRVTVWVKAASDEVVSGPDDVALGSAPLLLGAGLDVSELAVLLLLSAPPPMKRAASCLLLLRAIGHRFFCEQPSTQALTLQQPRKGTGSAAQTYQAAPGSALALKQVCGLILS
ncbi:hypothetical protein CDD83_10984 [Cordyceps sp. RAO-2017]|nr:hypothetical protein CDD83_10984 [Cordyceps sp. RAO-2017]